ncbi:winged helix-turn-helix domain-containing protein [uncultured Amnibacterium sp.]|uniref:winged helix-turn-helix domain-containing protein n=1 Tax=uncultured Amnibacterium sp. TaxID=1631851 RepID=UPI0035CA4049
MSSTFDPDAIPSDRQPQGARRPDASSTSEVRGFAIYVGLDEQKARAAGIDLASVVEALRTLTAQLVPGAETSAAVALAPAGIGGRDVDIVRHALTDLTPGSQQETVAKRRTGMMLDLGRKRLRIDERIVPLTYRELELLQFLVLREGLTVPRAQIIETIWVGMDGEVPNERTIDVHVRRLRMKLGKYGDVVRTVRGGGYRFDRQGDVVIRYGEGPSPDRF